jgi:hypothetical protein
VNESANVAQSGSVAGDDQHDLRRIMYVTNRYNLLECLSSRLIAPRAAYDKYYRDTLELSAGRILLVSHHVGQHVIAACTVEGTGNFPVAIEIPQSAVGSSKMPALTEVGRERSAKPSDPAILAWASSLVIVLSRRCVVHFQSTETLNEHSLQLYENVRHSDWDYRVSPELFGDSNDEPILNWFSQLKPVTLPAGFDHRVADKEGGAIALLLNASTEFALAGEIATNVLEGTRESPALPPGVSYLVDHQKAAIDRDSRLFYAMITTLQTLDPRSFAPSLFLDLLVKVDAINTMRSRDRALFDRGINRLRRLIANEVEFEAFPSSAGSTMLRALMLLLLRPEPARMAAWAREETNASDVVFASALLLSGYLSGRKRLPTTLRPAQTDSRIAEYTAARLNSAIQKTHKHRAVAKVGESRSTELLSLYDCAQDSAERATHGKAVAAHYGWLDCFFEEYRLPEDDVERLENGFVRVRIRSGSSSEPGFSEEAMLEHRLLQFGESARRND